MARHEVPSSGERRMADMVLCAQQADRADNIPPERYSRPEADRAGYCSSSATTLCLVEKITGKRNQWRRSSKEDKIATTLGH